MTVPTHKEFIKRALFCFFVVFAGAGLAAFLLFSVLLNMRAAVVIAPMLGFLFGLFASSHMTRELKTSELEINASNKDPRKGLPTYLEETQALLASLRYRLHARQGDTWHYEPVNRYRLLGGPVTVDSNPLWIQVKGPRGFIRILASTLDLEKVFL